MAKKKITIFVCQDCKHVQVPFETDDHGFDHYHPQCTKCGGMIITEKR